MELNIVWLYPDTMNLYGEYANLTVLCRHLRALGVRVGVEEITQEIPGNFIGSTGFVYMGAGTERAQKAILPGLVAQGDSLREAVSQGMPVLFTGNAMETLWASITDTTGKVWEGLGLAGFTTEETDKRVPGDVIALPELWETPVVGFMNKCSVTHGVDSPLFPSLSLGFGNEKMLGSEGHVSGNLFATHLTGPILVKNPDFTDLLIRRIFAYKGWELPETLPVLPHEREAYEVTLKELRAQVGA